MFCQMCDDIILERNYSKPIFLAHLFINLLGIMSKKCNFRSTILDTGTLKSQPVVELLCNDDRDLCHTAEMFNETRTKNLHEKICKA